MRRIYRGVRLTPDRGTTSAVQIDVLHDFGESATKKLAKPLVHSPQHSPTGMNWGYQGSGPADLALAILLDYLNETPTPDEMSMGKPLAWRLHQLFKREFVAGWGDTWEISGEQIDAWLETPKVLSQVNEHTKLWTEMDEYLAPEPDLSKKGDDDGIHG